MIGRAHRFHGYGSLRSVYQHGQTARSPLISLKYNNRGQRPYRAAVVVSKKVHKSAVVRNRIRRRIYEICRRQSDTKLTGLDLVFTVFSEQVAELDADKLEALLQDLLQKATQTPVKHGIVKPVKPGK